MFFGNQNVSKLNFQKIHYSAVSSAVSPISRQLARHFTQISKQSLNHLSIIQQNKVITRIVKPDCLADIRLIQLLKSPKSIEQLLNIFRVRKNVFNHFHITTLWNRLRILIKNKNKSNIYVDHQCDNETLFNRISSTDHEIHSLNRHKHTNNSTKSSSTKIPSESDWNDIIMHTLNLVSSFDSVACSIILNALTHLSCLSLQCKIDRLIIDLILQFLKQIKSCETKHITPTLYAIVLLKSNNCKIEFDIIGDELSSSYKRIIELHISVKNPVNLFIFVLTDYLCISSVSS